MRQAGRSSRATQSTQILKVNRHACSAHIADWLRASSQDDDSDKEEKHHSSDEHEDLLEEKEGLGLRRKSSKGSLAGSGGSAGKAKSKSSSGRRDRVSALRDEEGASQRETASSRHAWFAFSCRPA